MSAAPHRLKRWSLTVFIVLAALVVLGLSISNIHGGIDVRIRLEGLPQQQPRLVAFGFTHEARAEHPTSAGNLGNMVEVDNQMTEFVRTLPTNETEYLFGAVSTSHHAGYARAYVVCDDAEYYAHVTLDDPGSTLSIPMKRVDR